MMLGCFHAYLENGSGAGAGPWKLDRLRKDFCNSFVQWWSKKNMCDCNNRLADIASMGARQFFFAPGGKPWIQTKKPIKAPDLQ